MELTISVVGLGKLGAPLAACLASKGLRVIAVDADPLKVEAVREGRTPVFEPGLEELIRASGERLSATTDLEAAVAASDITFIVVATPSEPSGGFSLRYALPVCHSIGRALRTKLGFHLVVLTSTVMPGMTDGPVRTAIEEVSGKRCGEEFGLCYGPEFIALGSVIHDFLNPDFVLIGESDRRSGEILEQLYHKVCENSPAIARMNLINAELAKLSVNTYVTTKISFANMLARICERLPGASVDVVTAALGLDSRIGPKYLRGAVSYGGPCFPRDNLALTALARTLGAPADIAEVTDVFNRSQLHWLADLVQEQSKGGVVGILGLTYKPDTDVVEEATGFLLAQELARRGVAVVAYDPAGGPSSARVLLEKVCMAQTAQQCIDQGDVVVVATPWQEFAKIPASQWGRQSQQRTLVDCWRALKHLENVDGLKYLGLGIGNAVELVRSAVSGVESQESGC
jgi:UDPglucose 6-dehydrogenase